MVDSPDEKSVLVERLLRRQSEPVGVINLKQFQTQLARVPSWMVQRSRFLERWQSRYAFGESEPGSSTELMLATPVQPITTEPNLTSQLSSAMLSERIYQEKIAPPIEKISDSQAGQTFRLSRKAVPLAPDSNSLSKQVNSSEKIETPANTSEKNSPSLRTIVESVTVSNPDSKPAATLDQPQRTVAPKEEEIKVTIVELKQIQVSNLSTATPLLLRQSLQSLDKESNRLRTGSGTIQREVIGGQKQSGNQANRDIAAVNSELATTSIAVVPEIPSREVPGNLSIPTNLVWRKTTSEPARTVFSAANNGYTNSSLPSVSIPVNPNRPNSLRQMSSASV